MEKDLILKLVLIVELGLDNTKPLFHQFDSSYPTLTNIFASNTTLRRPELNNAKIYLRRIINVIHIPNNCHCQVGETEGR